MSKTIKLQEFLVLARLTTQLPVSPSRTLFIDQDRIERCIMLSVPEKHNVLVGLIRLRNPGEHYTIKSVATIVLREHEHLIPDTVADLADLHDYFESIYTGALYCRDYYTEW